MDCERSTGRLRFDDVENEEDRSWTIAPTLGWLAAFSVVSLYLLDGDLHAVADRLTARRDGQPAIAGPVFAAPPVVADADDTDDRAPPPPAPPQRSSSGVDVRRFGTLDDTCVEPAGAGSGATCTKWAMDDFYRAVAQSRAGKLGHPVRVSWYGDSVIATDAIPGRLRQRMQAELGDGGPGFVYVVAPHRFCAHTGITRSSSGGFVSHAISTQPINDGLYGPGGATALVDDGRATIKLVSGKATAIELYYLAQPKGGTVALSGDGVELATADTSADPRRPGWLQATAKDGIGKLDIVAKGRVRLFGVALENARGAVVDNLGIVSVNVKSFAKNDVPHWTAELAHRNADLILIMIGANEAEWLSPGDGDTKAYQAHYEQVLGPIRQALPHASCVVVSPTDQAEAKDDGYASRPVMPVLVEAQRRAARSSGCAFYSVYEWMGGKGSSVKWFRKGLVGNDFQHLSQRGANKLSDALYDALIAGANAHAK
jgi:lysophospholipase L1-like esterase